MLFFFSGDLKSRHLSSLSTWGPGQCGSLSATVESGASSSTEWVLNSVCPSWNRFSQNIWTKKSKAWRTKMKPFSLRTEGDLNWMLSEKSGHWAGLSAKPYWQNVVSGVGAELHDGLCRFAHYVLWTLSIRDNINCIWHVDASFPCHICVKIRHFFSFLRIAMKQTNASRGTRNIRRVLVWAYETTQRAEIGRHESWGLKMTKTNTWNRWVAQRTPKYCRLNSHECLSMQCPKLLFVQPVFLFEL